MLQVPNRVPPWSRCNGAEVPLLGCPLSLPPPQVNLYADPPCASRSAHAGTMSGGCRVMAFSIPRASAAAISTAPNPQLPVGGGELSARKPPAPNPTTPQVPP